MLNVQANGTTINCNGHTILATNGGTLVDFQKGTSVETVENCQLVGFTNPITAEGSQVTITNTTIYNQYTYMNGTGINLTTASNFNLRSDNVTGYTSGIVIKNGQFGTMINDYANASAVGYYLNNVSGSTLFSSIGNSANGVGLRFVNSTVNYIQNDQLNGKTSGLMCTGSAAPTMSANRDNGNNQCSALSGCTWITSSAAQCHT